MTCYKTTSGCGVYENRSCDECPYSKPPKAENIKEETAFIRACEKSKIKVRPATEEELNEGLYLCDDDDQVYVVSKDKNAECIDVFGKINEQCRKCFHFEVCANVMKQQLLIQEKMLKIKNPKCKHFINTKNVIIARDCDECKFVYRDEYGPCDQCKNHYEDKFEEHP